MLLSIRGAIRFVKPQAGRVWTNLNPFLEAIQATDVAQMEHEDVSSFENSDQTATESDRDIPTPVLPQLGLIQETQRGRYDAYGVEVDWNSIKLLQNRSSLSPDTLEVLVQRSMDLVQDLGERHISSVWHGLLKMGVVHPEIMAKLTSRLLDDPTLRTNLRPRNFINILYSIGRLYRLAVSEKHIQSGDPLFDRQDEIVEFLLKESFGRLNELNEQDLANLASSMSNLEVPADSKRYRILIEETERDVHLRRFSPLDMLSLCYGLRNGANIDILRDAEFLVREILSPRLLPEFDYWQLLSILRRLTPTSANDKTELVIPFLEKLTQRDNLLRFDGSEFRYILHALAAFAITEEAIWSPLLRHMIAMDLNGVTDNDLTLLFFSMGRCKIHHQEIMDLAARRLLSGKAIGDLPDQSIANCFYGMSRLRYKNVKLQSLLLKKAVRENRTITWSANQLSVIAYSIGLLRLRATEAVSRLIAGAERRLKDFGKRPLLDFIYGVSQIHQDVHRFPMQAVFKEVFHPTRLEEYSESELATAMDALGKMAINLDRSMPTIKAELIKEHRMKKYSLKEVVRICGGLSRVHRAVPDELIEFLLSSGGHLSQLSDSHLVHYFRCLQYIMRKLDDKLAAQIDEILSRDRLRSLRTVHFSEIIHFIGNSEFVSEDKKRDLIAKLVQEFVSQHGYKLFPSKPLLTATLVAVKADRGFGLGRLQKLLYECSNKASSTYYSESMLRSVLTRSSRLNTPERKSVDDLMEEKILNWILGHSCRTGRTRLRSPRSVREADRPSYADRSKRRPVAVWNVIRLITSLRSLRNPTVDKLLAHISRDKISDIRLMIAALEKEDLREASSEELIKLVSGLCHRSEAGLDSILRLLTELLKASRCETYTDDQLIRLIRDLSNLREIDSSHLAGLIQLLSVERCAAMDTSQIIALLRSLLKVQIVDEDIVGPLFKSRRNITSSELKELDNLARIMGCEQARIYLNGLPNKEK